MIYPAVHKDDRGRRGKTMAATKLVPVRLTIVAQEDLDAIRAGLASAERRAIRIRRLTHEAFAQDGVLSQNDVALLMGCSAKAVSDCARLLRDRGEHLPWRGYLHDMGSWPSHKAEIIRLYLQGLLTPDIAARTWHSKQAVDRYIRGFERVRLLASRHPRDELPLLTGMSRYLIDQYLELIDQHRPHPTREVTHAAVSS